MRIFQAIGLADAIALHTAPIDGMDFVNGDGQKLFGFHRVHEERLHGWPNANMFFQPELEAALRAGLERFDHVTVRLGDEVESITERADAVVLQVRDLAAGTIGMVHARNAVGCDGARSLTRQTIGSELAGSDRTGCAADRRCRRAVPDPARLANRAGRTKPPDRGGAHRPGLLHRR